MYCTSFPEQKDVNKYAWNDNHGFPQARVNIPLRNFDAFSKAFQCPIGSKMNPKEAEKCQLW
jgi:endothelin-converting enzyme